MKYIASALLFSGALAFCLLACSKNAGKTSSNSTSSKTQVLTLSQSTVAKGQPLVVSAPSGVSASSIRWTVSPSSAYTHLTTGNGQAMLLFAKAGSYRVTASYSAADSSGNDSCSAPVTVSDSVYCPGGPQNGYDTLSLAGVQVTLVPAVDSGASGSNVVLLAESDKTFPCFPSFIYSLTQATNGISLNLVDIVAGSSSGNCDGSHNQAVSYLFLNELANGTYPFSVVANGVTYTGSLTVTDTGVSFTWNYTSGVIISPKQINKN